MFSKKRDFFLAEVLISLHDKETPAARVGRTEKK
jgi:hypothetical protein